MSKDNERLTFKMKLYTFLDGTTFHGMSYISDQTGRIIRRLLWFLMVGTAFGLFLWLVADRVIYYGTHPKTVNIDIIQPKRMLFPAVTVCNQNFVRASVAVEKGLYDSLDRDFKRLKARIGTESVSEDCVDKFYGFSNTTLRKSKSVEKSSSDEVIYGVTSDVCQKLCVNRQGELCNGLLYDVTNKVCTLTKYLITSRDVDVVPQYGTDYLQRVRCPNSLDIRCSFEANLCEFRQDDEDDADWTKDDSSNLVENTGPTQDHTSGMGFFIYLHVGQDEKAFLSSSLISAPNKKRCVEFYYHMKGRDQGRLAVNIKYGDGSKQRVWERSGPQGDTWRRGFFRVDADLFYLQFEGIGTKGIRDYIALDDIRIAPCDRFTANCKRHLSGTDYMGNIATTRSGLRCRTWLDVARTITSLNPLHFPNESLTQSENFCRNPGLKLGSEVAQEPWCFWGTDVNQYEECDIPFCECTPDEFMCENQKCISKDRLCDGGDDCGDHSDEHVPCTRSPTCNFESNFICGYHTENNPESKFVWRFRRASTDSFGTGPIVDFTQKTSEGGYIYTDATLGRQGDQAWLISPLYTNSTVGCFSFAYHIYGEHAGSLRLVVSNDLHSTDNLHRLWEVGPGGGPDSWREASVTLNHPDLDLEEGFSMVFVAVRGNGTRGDIAVDGAKFTPGFCSDYVKGCRYNQYRCNNGRCISKENLCDGTDNCLDGTDENAQCAQLECTFDGTSTCGYSYESTHDLMGIGWKRTIRNDTMVTIQDGDTTDTIKDMSYMLSQADMVGKAGVVNTLYTGWWNLTTDSCATYLRKAAGTLAGVLKVYVQTEEGRDTPTEQLVHVYVRDETQHWIRERIQLYAQEKRLRLKFEAISIYVGSNILIDNVRIEEGDCDESYKMINCSFDDTRICGYQVQLNGDFTWRRVLDKDRGYVLAVDNLALLGPNTTSVRSPVYEFNTTQCLQFSYNMTGIDPGQFSVFRHSNGYYRRLFNVHGDQGRVWHEVALEVPPGEASFLFQAVRGYEDSSLLQIDNITVSHGPCASGMCIAIEEFQCDSGQCITAARLCDGRDDCGDWSDETKQCETSCTPSPNGDVYAGRKNVTFSGRHCLPWTQSSSSDVPLTAFPDATAEELLNHCRNPGGLQSAPWCITDAQEKTWELCDVLKCECRRNQFQCRNGECVAESLRCDGNDDCGDLSDEDKVICPAASMACDFEEPYLCGYVADMDSWPYGWHWSDEPLGSDLAPVRTSGHYIYAYSKTGKIGTQTRIRSPETTLLTNYCLHLTFFLSTSITKNLKIYLQRAQGVLNLLDEVLYQSGAIWFSRRYTLKPGTYRLVLEAELTINTEVIAIDNIELVQGTCQSQVFALHTCFHEPSGLQYTGTLNTTSKGECLRWDSPSVPSTVKHPRLFPDDTLEEAGASCRNPGRKVQPYCYVGKDTEALCDIGNPFQIQCDPGVCEPGIHFRCGNGRCVDINYLCDGVNHCGDGSDEIPCDRRCLRSRGGEYYLGTQARARDGTRCETWVSVHGKPGVLTDFILAETSLGQARSYCRNPDHSLQGPWCYTNGGRERKFCSIELCEGFSECEEPFEFSCQDGSCIPQEKTCDGNRDCSDGDDEMQICESSRFETAREECRVTINGTEYLGTQNTTASGLPCQRWDGKGQVYFKDEDFQEKSKTAAENFCRNPDNYEKEPWCFTDDNYNQKELCKVPVCDNQSTCSASSTYDPVWLKECFMGTFEYEYIGRENETKTGLDCLNWDQVVARVVTELPDASPAEAGPSCRNSNWHVPYCYTHLPDLSWEDCRVSICPGALEPRGVPCSFDYDFKCGYTTLSIPATPHLDFLSTRWLRKGSPNLKTHANFIELLEKSSDLCIHNATLGTDFRGTHATTRSGHTCQRWDAQYPHMFDLFDDDFPEKNRTLAENFCRNPRFRERSMWCYTTNPDVPTETCDIPKCKDSMMLAIAGDLPGEAELYSPFFDHVNVSCLQFKYLLPDETDPSTLTVITEDEEGNRRIVWNKVGGEGFIFRLASVELRHLEGRQRIIFVSKQRASEEGTSYSTALDDVMLQKGSCPNKQDCAGEEDFPCTNGLCVSQKLTCNGYDDCADNSDEVNCTCVGYRCPDGRCIAGNLLGDGIEDCLGGADETDIALSERVMEKKNFSISAQKDPPAQRSDYEEYPEVDLDGGSMLSFFKTAAHQKNDFVHSCTYNSVPCAEYDISQLITDFGICYTFNINNTHDIMFRGANYGLKLILNVESYESMEGIHPAKGVKAHLHRPGILPPVSELGFNLATGFSYSINMEVTNATRLVPPWGKCGEVNLEFFDKYDRQRCQLECATNRSLDICHCVAPHMPHGEGNEVCGFRSYMDCYLVDSFTTSSGGSDCKCPEQCEEFTYTSHISFASLAERAREEILAGDISQLQAGVEAAARANYLKDAATYIQDLALFKSIAEIQNEILQVVGGLNETVIHANTKVKYNSERWKLAMKLYFDLYEKSYNTIQDKLADLIQNKLSEYGRVKKQMLFFTERVEYKFLELMLVLRAGPTDELQNSTLKATLSTEIVQLFDLFNAYMTIHVAGSDIGTCLAYNGTSVISEFVNYTYSVRNEIELGLFRMKTIETIWQMLEKLSGQLIKPCISDHIDAMTHVQQTLKVIAPRNTVQKRYSEIQSLFRQLQVRELRAPVIHTTVAYELILDQFLKGTISKSNMTKKVVEEVVPHMEIHMLIILQQIRAEFLEPFVSLIDQAFDQLKADYITMLSVLRSLQPYKQFSSILNRTLTSLPVWRRPVVGWTDKLKYTVFENGVIDMYHALPLSQLEGLIEEHVSVYREPISFSLSAYRRDLAIVENNITNGVAEMEALNYEQQKMVSISELNEDFIQDNFLIVEFYFAELNIRLQADREALNIEDLFGTIGGYSGMLVGGSVLSLIEIVDLLLMYSCGRFWVKKKKEEDPGPQDDGEPNWPEKNGFDNEGVTADAE